MNRITELAFRILALVNLGEGGAGLVATAFVLLKLPPREARGSASITLGPEFYPMLLVNLGCALLLIVSAPALWRKKRTGLLISFGVLAFELLYFVSMKFGAATGIGNLAIGVQLMTAYPIVLLVLGGVAALGLRSVDPPSPSPSNHAV